MGRDVFCFSLPFIVALFNRSLGYRDAWMAGWGRCSPILEPHTGCCKPRGGQLHSQQLPAGNWGFAAPIASGEE